MMDQLNAPRILTAALLVGIAACIGAIALEMGKQRKPDTSPAALANAGVIVPEALPLPPFALASADRTFVNVTERPLFVPTRRAAPAGTQTASNMRKGQFVLIGTTVTPQYGDVAILKEVSTSKNHMVRKGQSVNGLSIDEVEFGRVVLRQGDETEEVLMKTQVSPKVAAAPAPVPAGGVLPTAGAAQPAGQATATVARPAAAAPANAPLARPPRAGAPAATPGAQQPPPLSYGNSTFEEIIARRRAARAQQQQQQQQQQQTQPPAQQP